MIFTKSQIYKLLFITLALCCLTATANAGKLPKSHIKANVNGTDIATPAKAAAEVATTETAVAAINETESKSSEEEDDDDDDEEDDDDSDTADKDDEDETAEKNAVQPAADTSLSVFGIVRGLWNWIREDISESLFGDDGKTSAVGEGRTFGKIRRLQMALIPIVFKFGVLAAMVAFLVAIGLKTLFLVKVLIAMNVLAILAKFFTLKTNFGHVEHVAHHPPPPAWNWTPYASTGWQSAPVEQHHSNKEIHLHIHGGQVQPQVSGYSYSNNAATAPSHGWERRNDPYSAYDNMALQGQQNELLPNELTNAPSDQQQFSGNYPTNHRML